MSLHWARAQHWALFQVMLAWDATSFPPLWNLWTWPSSRELCESTPVPWKASLACVPVCWTPCVLLNRPEIQNASTLFWAPYRAFAIKGLLLYAGYRYETWVSAMSNTAVWSHSYRILGGPHLTLSANLGPLFFPLSALCHNGFPYFS